MNKTIFLNQDIQVLVVSSGGVGTTFFMNAIAAFKTTNCINNTDGFKHIPIPPIILNKEIKVIYILGNPVHACISLFRRQYHHTQSQVVQKYSLTKNIIPFSTSIDQYSSIGKDGLFFETHLNNWLTQYPVYPTLFIKYEKIHELLPQISHFLGLPSEFIHQFPDKRSRKSSSKDLSSKTLVGLLGLYQSFQEKINQMPAFFIRPQKKPLSRFSLYFSKPYKRALIDFFLKQAPVLRKIINHLTAKKTTK